MLKGDSGGPLWVAQDAYKTGKESRAYLVGVVSRGRDCASQNLPGLTSQFWSLINNVVLPMQDQITIFL